MWKVAPLLNSVRLGFSVPQQSRQVWRSYVSWSVELIYTRVLLLFDFSEFFLKFFLIRRFRRFANSAQVHDLSAGDEGNVVPAFQRLFQRSLQACRC